MPVHGTWRHLRANAALAASTGVPEENIVLAENGVSVDLVGGKAGIAGAVPLGKMFVDGLVTGDVGEVTLGERLTLSSGFISITVVVRRGTGKPAAPVCLHSRGFSEDPKALEPATRKVQEALEALAAEKVTDPARIAQSVRRAVGKWVGEVYRRQPMIVPTVLEIELKAQIFSAYADHSICDAVRSRPAGRT